MRNPKSEIGLARSAGILGLGNIASRVIGLARESVISGYFGSSGELSAFNLAARVPTMIYDLLVGGMLSAALVPVFSDYARPERREELARVASAVFSLIAVAMALIVIVLELFAGPIAGVLGDFEDPALQGVLANSLRVIAPAVLLFGLSGGVTGLLYALKRFSYTALSGAVFNLGIVIAAPLLANRIGVYALPLGIIGGSLMQLAVMLPGLRDLRLRLSAAWEHPAVRRILRLYAPIALGLIVTQAQIIVDGRWASATGEQSVSWMRYATTLIQLPLGLVPVAVSLAALPSLSQRAVAEDWEGFRGIFARGLRLVLLLLIPAAVGLWVLAEPVIRLLFEHGSFRPADTAWTATALRFYLLGLMFAGVDFLLNYTFYARQDTRTPAIVGVIAVGFYFIAALALKGPLGFLGLVLADSVKQAGHALIMTGLLLHSVGRLRGQRIQGTAFKAIVAALVMGLGVWQLTGWLTVRVPAGFAGEAVVVAVAAGVGGAFYILALRLLGVEEVIGLFNLLPRRLRRPGN
ncbi:MAG: murein biosynthesis integral membrane protein MurJ [Anaerolineae bacterium CG2_30_64_16]|nr:MAG: murein biosynthesis integral membrane protein MurJ [Anaerolineae bacterium CG2_30_64_16]